MSNKIQMLCNPQNVGYRFFLRETWRSIEETQRLIDDLRVERKELIICILFMKKKGKLLPPYLTERLSEIPTLITAWEFLIDCDLDSISEFSKRLVVC